MPIDDQRGDNVQISARAERVRKVLEPQSIAIIGASPRNHSAAGVLNNLKDFGFTGAVYPVNPKYEELFGLRCYPHVDAIDAPIDVAVLLIPADGVPDAVQDLVRLGVSAAIIMSAGFAEDQRGSGHERDRRLREAVAGSELVLCGPNSEGFFTARDRIALSFSPSVSAEFLRGAIAPWAGSDADLIDSISGGVAVVAQSGGLGFSLFGQGVEQGIGFSRIISIGNEFDLDALDCAEYLLAQDDVTVVAMYVEGFRHPERLREVAELARSHGKALVIGKSGNSESGQKAAMSHTGHLAGDAAINEAAFAEFGVVVAHDQEELLDLVAAVSRQPPARGGRVGVISWSGGTAVWTADACERAGLEVPELDAEIRAGLTEVLPDFAGIRNPIDLTAAARTTPGDVLQRIGAASYLDAFVLILSLGHPGFFDRDLAEVSRFIAETGKPVVVYGYTTPHPANRKSIYRDAGLPIYLSSTRAARAISALVTLGARSPIAPISPPGESVETALASERETTALLQRSGFPTTRQELATSATAAVEAAGRVGYPVALKLQAPSMPHKKDAGGVMLGLDGPEAVTAAFEQLMTVAADYADVEGILVQEMIPSGLEMLVGISNSSGFGPMVLLGVGGSGAERLADTTLRPAPLDSDDVREMLSELRHGALLLEPVSGLPSYPVEPLVDFVVELSRFAIEHADDIRELDINPAIVTADGVRLVDSMMVRAVDSI